MGKFFDDLEKGLLEAIAIEKGTIEMVEKPNMSAKTLIAVDYGEKLIDDFIAIRKSENLTQKQVAEMSGNKQQAISRMEKKDAIPSLSLFANMLNSMGYELKINKK